MARAAVRVHGDFYGYIEDGVFVKHVRRSRHLLRNLKAWALDAESFDKLIKPAVREIQIVDVETGRRYRTSLVNFLQNRGEIEYRGFGRQYFMTLDKWGVIA